MTAADVRGLSLLQPWLDLVLDGGKDIENRLKWRGSSYRGVVLLHASQRRSRSVEADTWAFCVENGIDVRASNVEPIYGAILGRARVVDVIMPGGRKHRGFGYPPSYESEAYHPKRTSPWYMGGFALVLEDIERIAPIKYPGSLGFFRVRDDVREQALSAPAIGAL